MPDMEVGNGGGIVVGGVSRGEPSAVGGGGGEGHNFCDVN